MPSFPLAQDCVQNVVSVNWGALTNVCVALGWRNIIPGDSSIPFGTSERPAYAVCDAKTGAVIAQGKPWGGQTIFETQGLTIPLSPWGTIALISSNGDFVLSGQYWVLLGVNFLPDHVPATAVINAKTGAIVWSKKSRTDGLYPIAEDFPHIEAGLDSNGFVIGLGLQAESNPEWVKLAPGGGVVYSGTIDATVSDGTTVPTFDRSDNYVCVTFLGENFSVTKYTNASVAIWTALIDINWDQPALDKNDDVWLTAGSSIVKLSGASGGVLASRDIGCGVLGDLDVTPSGKIVTTSPGTAHVLDPADLTKILKSFPIVDLGNGVRVSATGAGLTTSQLKVAARDSTGNNLIVHSYDISTGEIVWSQTFDVDIGDLAKRPPFKPVAEA